MSVKTQIQNLRASFREAQLRKNAESRTPSTSMGKVFAIPALAVMAFMVLISAIVPGAQASIDLNGTIGPLLDSVAALIPSIINLIVAAVPAIVVLAIVGFVVAFLDKILKKLG